MSEDIEEVKRTIIVASVAAQVLHEALDDLENTSYYKQTLKSATKTLQRELTKTCDQQTEALFGADDKSMLAMQDGVIEVAKQLLKANPVNIAAMGDMLKMDMTNNKNKLTK